MSILDEMLNKPAKNIKVKIENIKTGEVVKTFECGTNQSKADKLENGLIQKTNLDDFFVYQSITV